MIAASNARFAKSGAKEKGAFSDPLFDIIAGSEAREAQRQSQAEESLRLLEQQERAGERFEQAETDRLRRIAEGWRDATDATRKFVEQYEDVIAAVALGPAAGGLTSEEGALARFLIGNELDGLGTVKAAIKEVDELTLQAARNIQDQIGQGLVDIMDGNFKSIGKSFGDMLKRMVAEALAADLGRALMGSFATTGEIGGILGSIFGGARALGGPVSAGSAYLVGEKGPELFVPQSGGYIVPNGAGVSVIQNISVGAGASRGEVMTAMQVAKEQAKREIAESMRRGGVFA
jgi:phage-related minor tail protein